MKDSIKCWVCDFGSFSNFQLKDEDIGSDNGRSRNGSNSVVTVGKLLGESVRK